MNIRKSFAAPFGKHPELRAGIVPRWAIIKTSKAQSVAEHSYNVAMITKIILSDFITTPLDDNEIIVTALGHDFHEIYTGDIPTPAKMRKTDAEAMPIEKMIIKLADCIESYAFIKRNCADSLAVKMWVMNELEIQINILCGALGINEHDIWPTISGMVL